MILVMTNRSYLRVRRHTHRTILQSKGTTKKLQCTMKRLLNQYLTKYSQDTICMESYVEAVSSKRLHLPHKNGSRYERVRVLHDRTANKIPCRTIMSGSSSRNAVGQPPCACVVRYQQVCKAMTGADVEM
jgi:hypothetical protein